MFYGGVACDALHEHLARVRARLADVHATVATLDRRLRASASGRVVLLCSRRQHRVGSTGTSVKSCGDCWTVQ